MYMELNRYGRLYASIKKNGNPIKIKDIDNFVDGASVSEVR